jgi:hypothetical protein
LKKIPPAPRKNHKINHDSGISLYQTAPPFSYTQLSARISELNIMPLPPDILRRIDRDFPEQKEAVTTLLESYNGREPHRVIRSILFLAKGNEELLLHNLQAAIGDYRDVLYWAEYDRNDNRLRDFNQPFDDCEGRAHA